MSVPQDTGRLQPRQARVEDAPFMLKLLTEPAWRKFISQHEVKCEASALRYMEERIFPPYREALGFWVVVFRDTQQPIGICGLVKRPYLEKHDLGFAFLEEVWGTGVAKEAAVSCLSYARDILGLAEICAITVEENIQSIGLLKKLVFRFLKHTVNPDEETLEVYGRILG